MQKSTLQDTKFFEENQSGQTLVEFILILAGVAIVSFSFMAAVNGNIADRWKKIATVILDDPNQTLEVR